MDNENTNTNNGELSVQIYTDFKTALPETIKWNYDNLHKSLEDALAPLHGLVLKKDEEGIKFAKGKRAAINKMMNLILEARVETKKRYLAPFEDFEQKANALIAMCRTASGEFDSFVKACEEEAKNAKRKRIHEYLVEKVLTKLGVNTPSANSPYWATYENSNPRWMNATYKFIDIAKEIDARVDEAYKAVCGAKMFFESDAALLEKAMIEVVKDFDMNRVIQCINAYKEEQKRISEAAERRRIETEAAEQKKAEAMERAKAELANKREAAKNADSSPSTGTAAVVKSSPSNAPTDPLDTYSLRFDGDESSMCALFGKLNELGLGSDGCVLTLHGNRSKFIQLRKWLEGSGVAFAKAYQGTM